MCQKHKQNMSPDSQFCTWVMERCCFPEKKHTYGAKITDSWLMKKSARYLRNKSMCFILKKCPPKSWEEFAMRLLLMDPNENALPCPRYLSYLLLLVGICPLNHSCVPFLPLHILPSFLIYSTHYMPFPMGKRSWLAWVSMLFNSALQ